MTCIADLRLFVVVISEVAPSTGDKGGGGVFGGNATKRLSLPAKKKRIHTYIFVMSLVTLMEN